MNALKKYALPASLIGGGLIVLALVLGLIGAFRGPSAGALEAQATKVASQESADKAEILTAIQNTQGWSDADKAWLTNLIANDDDFSAADMQTILAAIKDNSLSAEEVRQIVAEEVAKLNPATPPAAPTATETPTAQPTAQGQPGWVNLTGKQVWVGPEGNSSVHIEFVDVDPASTNATIGIAGGEALYAFAAMGGNARGCAVGVTPLRDGTILSCPVTIVRFSVSQDGETVTVVTPTFGNGNLSFGEVAELLRQGELSGPLGLWEPKAGFFLAWVSTQPISGLYVP